MYNSPLQEGGGRKGIKLYDKSVFGSVNRSEQSVPFPYINIGLLAYVNI